MLEPVDVSQIPLMGYGCVELSYLTHAYSPASNEEVFFKAFPGLLSEVTASAFGISSLIARGLIDVTSDDMMPSGQTGALALCFQSAHSWVAFRGARGEKPDGLTLVVSPGFVAAIQHRAFGTSFVRVVEVPENTWNIAINFAKEFQSQCDRGTLAVDIEFQMPPYFLANLIQQV